MFFSFFFSSDLTSHCLCLIFSSPSLTPHLFVPITTKPCHHGSCGHVNQPSQHHLFPAVYLQPNKGVCLFVVAGVECCVGWGLLFNNACCYQPPSLKRPIQHRESMEEERRQGGKMSLWGLLHLETISDPPSQRSQNRLGTKANHRLTWKANK